VSGLEPRSLRFRAEREADWWRLEALLGKAERGRADALSEDELIALPLLYRAVISSLSVARATALDLGLIAYLEGLATRAYFFVYGVRGRLGERLARFFQVGWPRAVKAIGRETVASGLIFLIAVLAGFVLVARDADWYGSIIPEGLSQGRDPTASTAFLKGILYNSHQGRGLSLFATALFTHNAQIAILAFALGFAFCLPTALLVAQNGLTLGALIALYASRGLALPLCGWLFIHGATELFATILAGAAGFRIGWAVMFPGRRSRLDAAAEAGRVAGAAMAGVMIMLIVAGVLEGIGRQLIQRDAARWTIAGVTLALWLGYFYLPRRGPGP
jgi:uncharacterized membrane protein SpoIIM required for sporulation